MGFLPSKNFIAPLSAILVVALVGWMLIQIWGSPSGNFDAPDKSAGPTDIQELAVLDSDGDGLKDWEEVLWKTDPKNEDTDGDGTKDQDEISAGRDPLVSVFSKDDKLKIVELPASKSSGTQTLSAKVAEDFATRYFTQKGLAEGGPISGSIKDNLVRSLSYNIQAYTAAYKDIFKETDFKVSEKIDHKNYLNNVARALDTNFKDVKESELVILEAVADTNDVSRLGELDKYIIAYQTTLDFLKKEPAPPAYLESHTSLANSFNNTAIAVRNMQKMESDPVRSLVGLQLYYQEIARANKYLKDLKAKTQKDGIAFNDSEAGAFFNKYFEQL